jgi:hypothetical protein
MVHVRTVSTQFHARVIAARLGAEGILTQLRGNVGGPYPFGEVSVWVGEDDAEEASELLLADEVEAAFAPHPDDEEPRHRLVLFGWPARKLFATAGLIIVIAVATLSTRIGL